MVEPDWVTNNMVDHLEVSSTGGRRAAVQSLEKENQQGFSKRKLVFLNFTCAPTKPSSFLYIYSLMMREKHIVVKNYVGGYCKGGWGHLSSISLINLLRPKPLGVFYLLISKDIFWLPGNITISICFHPCAVSMTKKAFWNRFNNHTLLDFVRCVSLLHILFWKVCFSWNQLALSVEQ